jgi:hypothetical protein
MANAVLPFFLFCENVLNLNLRLGQRVIAKVAFGDYQPCDLEGEEKDIALQLFGGLEKVDQSVKNRIVMRLGRGSGKTTLCSAFAIYTILTADCRKCGPGDVPYFIIVAPDKPTAMLSIQMCLEMMKAIPAIARFIVSETATSIQIRRPDGRMVRIGAFAATKAGRNVRGKTILGFTADEAEFFTSNEDGTQDFAVDDKQIFQAMKPRMLLQAKGLFISTPWPIETYAGKLFDDNWGKAVTALAIKAPTLLVRGDEPEIVEMINDELAKDPENARRELFCEIDGLSGDGFFDINALTGSLEESQSFPMPWNPKYPTAIGCDLGFTRDSSAIVVVQYDGNFYRTVFAKELKPKPGKPLKPGEVIKEFAEIAKRYHCPGVVADAYYREALKEQLREHNLLVFHAPEGSTGKAEVFQRTRSVLHEGQIRLPMSDVLKRMVAQAKMVTSKATPGGTTTIKIPRKIGMGHGDIVSAWVLAVHKLAYERVSPEVRVIHQDSPEWAQESLRRLVTWQEKQQANYLKTI